MSSLKSSSEDRIRKRSKENIGMEFEEVLEANEMVIVVGCMLCIVQGSKVIIMLTTFDNPDIKYLLIIYNKSTRFKHKDKPR